jgi:hypothetical protein
LIDGLIFEKILSIDCAPLNLDRRFCMDAIFRLLNLLNVEVDGNQLFLEIYDLNVVLLILNGELVPSVSVQSHSENKSNQKHNIFNMWVNFLSDAKHLPCSELFNMF